MEAQCEAERDPVVDRSFLDLAAGGGAGGVFLRRDHEERHRGGVAKAGAIHRIRQCVHLRAGFLVIQLAGAKGDERTGGNVVVHG